MRNTKEETIQKVHRAEKHVVLGLMSGTSLDGLDMALCEFEWQNGGGWRYEVKDAATIEYPETLRRRLKESMKMSALELVRLDVDLGGFFAERINRFLSEQSIAPELIASHGHTVFHLPKEGITTQIGNGAVIAAKTGIDTVCDFRQTDVAHGGQGAPLVPAGDRLLFGKYDMCLNLGGIANISYKDFDYGFDICPCNMALNHLANQLELSYDKNGGIARSNTIDSILLEELDKLPFYRESPPKSLGKEWFDQQFRPVLDKSSADTGSKIATVTCHIAKKICNEINRIGNSEATVLVTGGGAKNRFLIESFSEWTDKTIIVPDERTIDYKESIIFALLGLLRLRGEVNCLSAVTGAERDCIGGAIYLA